MVFYGLIVLLIGLFLIAAFATLEEPPPPPQPPAPVAAAPPVPPTGTPTTTPTPTPTEQPTATPLPATATPIVHVVQAGDNFIKLGQQYGVAWQAIAAANGLPENAVLRLGQELIIPGPG